MSEIEHLSMEEGNVPGEESPVSKRVLVIFPHPDDADFSCGGTMARWAREGNEITLCLVTDGASGSDDPAWTPARLAETRETEQREAARILGIADVIFLRQRDGTIVHDMTLRRELTRVMRRVRPHILICGDPSVFWHGNEYINHPDHRATADAVLAAAFPASGNRLYFPELLVEGLEPWKIKEIYVASPSTADTWIDITETIDLKIAALKAHASQMGDWDPTEMIQEWAAADGAKHDPPVKYAEDFRHFTISG
ncbi:MAG: PIG-L deacetylase family protein [Thermomicrobiales bacterium]